jgi:hypothetical protein
LSLLATITLQVVPFHVHAPFPALLPFLNASWKLCYVRVFNTACDSASITSIVSFVSVLSLVGETEKSRVGTTIMLFLVKDSLVKKEV